MFLENKSIVSSFVANDELFHIYETDSSTYLSKVKNNQIEPFEKILENTSFYNWHYSYRCKNLNGTNELLKFKTKEENVFGLMEIIEDELFITYFANNAELKPRIIGTEKSNELLLNRLKTILADFDELTLNEIESKEQIWGTFDITPNHKIGIGESMNPNKYVIDTNKSYLIVEDSIISNSIMYYATKETDLVRVVSINWEETNLSRLDLKKITKEAFSTKYKTLESILIQELGQPTAKRKETKGKYPATIWKTPNGLTIELINAINQKTNYNNIRVSIYEN